MKIWCERRFNALHPADPEAEEVIKGLTQGEPVQCELRRPRNVAFFRKAHALVRLVYENSDNRWPNYEACREDLTIAAGFFDQYTRINGDKTERAHSWAFASMSEDEFGQFYKRLVDVVLTEIFPDCSPDWLQQAIMEFVA